MPCLISFFLCIVLCFVLMYVMSPHSPPVTSTPLHSMQFCELIQNSTHESSTDQIRAMLELTAQEDVEVLMKILEGQQGDVLTKIMHLKQTCAEMTELKNTLSEQYDSLADDNASNRALIARVKEVAAEELRVRARLGSAEAEKARLTASISKVGAWVDRLNPLLCCTVVYCHVLYYSVLCCAVLGCLVMYCVVSVPLFFLLTITSSHHHHTITSHHRR